MSATSFFAFFKVKKQRFSLLNSNDVEFVIEWSSVAIKDISENFLSVENPAKVIWK